MRWRTLAAVVAFAAVPVIGQPPGQARALPAACPSGAFCDGFETQTGTTPGGDWAVTFPNCQGTGTATVDSATVHGGTRSLRIGGRAGYCNHVFVRTTRGVGAAAVYARFYVR